MMQCKNLTLSVLLPLLLVFLIGCADKPTAPDTLTEEEIALLVETAVADELAKITAEETDLSPQEIAQIALKSTVYLRVKTQKKTYYGSGFVVGEGLIATCEHVLEGMVSATAESVFDEKKYPLKRFSLSRRNTIWQSCRLRGSPHHRFRLVIVIRLRLAKRFMSWEILESGRELFLRE